MTSSPPEPIERRRGRSTEAAAMEYYTLGVALRTLRCRWFGKTDLERWRDSRSFDAEWQERAKLIARLVPKNSRVIDFGAGQRTLENHLDQSCSYIPSDIVTRGSDTIVFDLNKRPLPDLSYLNLQVATLAGVVEYINDLPFFVRWLGGQTCVCIASYECARNAVGSLGRFAENIRRTGSGWVNSYTESELLEIFEVGGFEMTDRISWITTQGEERIFQLRKSLC
jgi:hypothetical protein